MNSDMPRSFLVKRRKSDALEAGLESTSDPVLAAQEHSMHYKFPDSHTPRKLILEYHPTLPQYIPAKHCGSGPHGNSGPCYIYHHSNIIPPTNGCISYAPVPMSPRLDGLCFCLMCQQRAATLACNCQACLSLRFEQTAASVLRPSDKEPSIKTPPCCNGMACKTIPILHPQYSQYCHCLECVSKLNADSRFNTHVQVLVNRDVEQRGHFLKTDKDQNNNVSSNEQNEKTDIKTDGVDRRSSRDTSPVGSYSSNVKRSPHSHETTDNEDNFGSHHDNDIKSTHCSPRVNENKPTSLILKVNESEYPPLGEIQIEKRKIKDSVLSETKNKKRKLEEDVLFVNKIIKTENTKVECKLEDEIQTVSNKIDNELLDDKNEDCLSPKCERETYSQDEFKITIEKNENAEVNCLSQRTTPDGLFHNGFNYKDDEEYSRSYHQEDDMNAESNKRHYNTRHTSTRTHSYEKDIEKTPKLKKQKDESYTEMNKNLSRQRTKMNRLLANEHERRRVAQLNSAYQNLRQLIPGYQCNTKLPKIKILRYAINYIAHLDNILEADAV